MLSGKVAPARSRHQARWYADRLGCSAKTLQRAVQHVRGKSLKQLIDQRIALEAQRRLVHTVEPIKRVADGLGSSSEGRQRTQPFSCGLVVQMCFVKLRGQDDATVARE